MDTQALQESLQALFKPEDLTTVILVKCFKQGEPLIVNEPVTPMTMNALNDLIMVKLIVGPGNPGPAGAPSTSPGIGIEAWLPTQENWNGRIHNTGGRGGYDGGTQGSPEAVGWYYAAIPAGMEGAVSASTDIGHTPTDGSWGMNPDGALARPLWVDYAHRAQHEMAVKTKILATGFYGRPPKFCYYEGVSTGGRHGYRLAQEYPDDYDGIVANLPAINWAEWVTASVYRGVVIQRDLGGVQLTEGQMDLASNAAIHACDVIGGQHMGYILDYEACRYDPAKDPAVLCLADGGTNVTPDALTLAQAQAINKMWYGMTEDGTVPPPEKDNGVRAVLNGKRRWYGLARGTSIYNQYFSKLGFVAANTGGYITGQVALQLQNPGIADIGFKNASGDGQGLWKNLSYEELSHAFDRGVAMDEDFGRLASDNPDLSAFQARGGKFLSWHGWNDEAIPVQGTIQYYDRVMETMGGAEKVQSFFKLYLIPGAGHMSPHGTSNSDANPPIPGPFQFYQMMVDWVEKGIEPSNIIIESPAPDKPKRSAPLCPYPRKAVYVGGDPFKAESYVCG